ncbi:MAG: phosphopentomutase/phosphoglucosamine mutase [Methanomicrobiales archaeon]|nr:phosphopentomutase/phosphoglucosamine mutase [Methanomicrobiales archaeon]
MLFGSSGIRQAFGPGLLALAVAAGRAVAGSASRVVLAHDTRTTSPLLAEAVTAGLVAGGVGVASCGIAPTPSLAYAARKFDAGVMVTASHNPEPDNGIKLFNPDGSSFTRAQQEAVEGAIRGSPAWKDWRGQGSTDPQQITGTHIAAIAGRFTLARPLTVVVDCGNGAASGVTPALLALLGAEVVALNCNPAGRFARPSEPLEEHLPYLGEMVRRTGADCGIAHDGDADRMVAWDSRGRYIDGDRMLSLLARFLGARRVVTTVDASMAVEAVGEVHRTPVGDTYVSEHLRGWGDFGGEPSGAWIFPGHSLCPDGIYAAALLCTIASRMDLAAEVDRIPRYSVLRTSLPSERAREVLTALGAASATDGIRTEREGGWFLVRASGTEPRIRITAEGVTQERAEALLEEGRQMVRRANLH